MRPPRLRRLRIRRLVVVAVICLAPLSASAQHWSDPNVQGGLSFDLQPPGLSAPPAWPAPGAPGHQSFDQFPAPNGPPSILSSNMGKGDYTANLGKGDYTAAMAPEPPPATSFSPSAQAAPATSPQLPPGMWENRYLARHANGTFTLLPGDSVFKLDYRLRWLTDSHTSYEFGTPDLPPEGWTPLSRLVFSINSLWHGVGVGWERPGWKVQFEWLTPMQRRVQGDLEDYDWYPPNPDGSFTDLGVMRQRWTDAQMLDLAGQFRLLDRPLSLPLEVWPGAGFRWQRLGLMASEPFQLKEFNVWQEDPWAYYGDVIAFKQEYFVGYVGGEIRATIESWRLPPLQVTFRGDWGWTDGYNIDHHLIREGDRYTKQSTHGDTWRVGLVFETLLRRCLSLGFEVDYLEISTKGRHHLINLPEGIDLTWDHGVQAWSNQTWLTAFVRLRI